MIDNLSVRQNIEIIMGIFQEAQSKAEEEEDIERLITLLETEKPKFLSIAYEGAAMGLALKDLEKSNSLNRWNILAEESGSNHEVHVHVGLGWAIAKLKIPHDNLIEDFNPLLKWRVLDGCGYYYGLFNRRRTLLKQEIPDGIEGIAKGAFDQGVGRSIWYAARGVVEMASEHISNFNSARHSDLWRGLGIACAFVGGCDEQDLSSILTLSGSYNKQLAVGAALAARARLKANSPTNDAELACRNWCNLSAEEALVLTIDKEPKTGELEGDPYSTWLVNIENSFI